MPPSGEEARAQRKATSMPIVWLLLGLVAILVFTVMMADKASFLSSLKSPTAATASRLSNPPQKAVAD
jgi:hypothetical protein